VRNVEVLHIVKEERHILHTIKRSNANWIGHIDFAAVVIYIFCLQGDEFDSLSVTSL
jgi:hypothetical protein